ncbi:MAG: T9SS type A sorting domain-containing protein [Lewinellaceae bacterium]|nr:T9SS type A sorting domain-containing protein [Lewinellaceae bacterium]
MTYTVVPFQAPGTENRSANAQTAETIFDFSVAPNPVAGENTSLLFSGNFIQTSARIRVHDLAGRLMLEQRATIQPGYKYDLLVGELPAGMFQITVWTENGGLQSRTMVVMRN